MGLNANVLKMDKFGNVDDFTFVLSTKKYKHLGQLNNVNTETVDFKANLNGANELSFEVYKKVKDEVEGLWDDIIDLKSIYVPELNEYFEIQVTYDDKLDETKTIVGKSLCESELSQTYIYGTEINTETDIDRTDYTQTTFYNSANPKASLLHRVFSFVPQYTIKHVDASLCNLQRSFSIDNTTVYDFLTGECAEQFNCLFIFDSTDRSVSVYDLYTTCNDCGHRDAYNFVCPECGSTNVNYFGEDTDIFVNKENLSDDIKLETDVGSIKNCLRLRSGDVDMDAAIASMNPNGTRYIYYISEEQREDMSDELVNKIDEYDELVEQYTTEYQELALDIRELEDRKTVYESTMMPEAIEDDEEVPSDSISNTEIAKLVQNKLSPIGMEEMTSAISVETADIVVKNYARVFVNTSLVKIDTVEGSTFEYKGKDGSWDYGIWTGKIKLTAWSDPNDIAITDTLTLTIHDNYGEFLQQKVMKEMALNDKEGSVFDVLAIEDINEFKEALTKYCLSRLNSFRLSLDTAITTLVSLDQATVEADWYQDIYVPYHEKLLACADEILVREAQIKEVQDQLDVLYARQSEIQRILNFEDYLGEELYLEFCTYKREGEYHNENYISDGLSNAEIIDKAREFIEVAKKEMIRAATRRHTISTGLYNLMLMEEFKSLVHKFALGNFIRLKVGEELFRLRLNSYHLTFSDLNKLDVEFTDMSKSVDVISATQKILSDAQSMASNFSYISKQAEKGEKANESVSNIVNEGLNSALTQIKNNDNQEFVIDNNGILGRRYDDISGKYSPEQIRITHNIIALTENNWEDTTCALGKHKYTYYDVDSKTFKQSIGYGLSSKFSQNSYIYGSQIIGGDIYSENYSSTEGTYINLNDGSFNFGHKIIYDKSTDILTMKGVTIEWSSSTTPSILDINGLSNSLSTLSTGVSNAQTSANNAQSVANNAQTIGNNLVNGLGFTKISDSYVISPVIAGGTLLIGDKNGTYAEITSGGVLNCKGANIEGKIKATSGEFTGSIKGGDININNKFIVDNQGNVTLPSGTKLSWTDVTGTDGIATKTYVTGLGYQTASQVTTITENTIKTTNVIATNLTVKAANIDGQLTASQINTTGLIAENISGTTITGKTISGGSINIGNGTFKVDTDGKVSCSNLNVTGGTITLGDATLNSNGITVGSDGGKSTIGSFKIDNNSIFRGAWSASAGTTPDVFMCSGSNHSYKIGGSTSKSGWAFGAGGKFGVLNTGDVYCSSIKITGTATSTADGTTSTSTIGNMEVYGDRIRIKLSNIAGTDYIATFGEHSHTDGEYVFSIHREGSAGFKLYLGIKSDGTSVKNM